MANPLRTLVLSEKDNIALALDVVHEGVSLEQKGQEIFAKILAVASGEKTSSELLGYGDSEFVP